ncbi:MULTISPECIES: NUDIX hydrolase [Gordonia]|uniref:NUDIX domain-containing protein n=1 Tax=Gordonia aquimaris TaxID=2984863 RepID=A0A9X3D8N2_9ACTN|nr:MULTISPECIES: NUDIX domain-containing protein [Gordonia]MCX2966923.1 NUDIX domain-containing protein [Gordonia aquimaris]
MSSTPRIIVVSGVVIRDRRGRLLTVRKRGTSRFMLPGGKPETSESAVAAASRECAEEVGLVIPAHRLRCWGEFRSAAANESGCDIEATVFGYDGVVDELTPSAEIAEIRWLDLEDRPLPEDLAPLLIDHVIPAL